ncbi:hypothetical protein PF005_g21965 [Phytophthora fragariae]|uniref:Uncharacterized protein n=1 Tax=Phytophthora fragariae TaxID=53985 RepID=A0A6A3IMY5_9STRA|nr:hypothetical protein PF003_g3817 [Phytophthora fragariae]KAE8927114.1 hypothetical protein PF009_g22712 [Phytophthora fragariae]KAE8981865.1 hypothetical protein PF011_g21859 [Phytophthora fragariae]KAE9084827.1 hypothetical protein PF010_g20680 [Phytophthora fragariae]KAE9085590.1 hypothetical protein PF007_g21086 [Phytophthora fragariae]
MRTQHNLVLQVHLQACQGLRFTLAAQDSVTEKASVSFARIGTHYKTRCLFAGTKIDAIRRKASGR